MIGRVDNLSRRLVDRLGRTSESMVNRQAMPDVATRCEAVRMRRIPDTGWMGLGCALNVFFLMPSPRGATAGGGRHGRRHPVRGRQCCCIVRKNSAARHERCIADSTMVACHCAQAESNSNRTTDRFENGVGECLG